MTEDGWLILPHTNPTVSDTEHCMTVKAQMIDAFNYTSLIMSTLWFCYNSMCSYRIVNLNLFFYPHQISKKDVDNFKRGKCISKCELIVVWDPKRKNQKPERLLHKVNIKGASESCNYFYLSLNPALDESMSPH